MLRRRSARRRCNRDGACPEDRLRRARPVQRGLPPGRPHELRAGQRCDEATRACLAQPCETDRDCTRTQFCAPQGCLEGCRVDPDNCPIGQECGPNRQCRQAGGCANDAQCVTDNGPGWRCVDGGCETFCVDDNGCRDGSTARSRPATASRGASMTTWRRTTSAPAPRRCSSPTTGWSRTA
ncbi:MAG: hypothetical protein R3F60_09085 [bacterium]